jgi:hypothetical protein
VIVLRDGQPGEGMQMKPVAAGAEGAAAGLASFFNKSELVLAQSKEAALAARLRKMQKGVFHTAKAIHNGLAAEGYSRTLSPKQRHCREEEFRTALVTVTYRPDVEWSPLHIAKLIDSYRKWAKRHKARFAYVWTLELQQNGTPHYHIVWWMTGKKKPPFPDSQGWWPHGRSNAAWARSPVGYIAKYASKGTGGDLPKGARLWGFGGLKGEAKAERSHALAPKWLRTITRHGSAVKRQLVEMKEAVKRGGIAVFKVMAWVNELGMAFFGPWERQGGFTPGAGVVLRHRGYVECYTPCGEYFQIQMKA